MTVVVASLDNLDVGLCNGRFLGELLLEEVEGNFQIAVEEPADKTKCKHVAALGDALYVHAGICQACLYHAAEGACYHAVGVNAHLAQIVLALELGLLKVLGTETIGIYNDSGIGFRITVLGLQRCGIHCHKHVALIARSVYLRCTDVYLETTDAGQ